MDTTTGVWKRVREGSDHFRALLESHPDAVLISDFASAEFVDMNARACALFGYSRAELLGMSGRQLHAPDDSSLVEEISRDLIKRGRAFVPALRLRRKNGELFWSELRIVTYRVDERDLYVAFVRDASERLSRVQALNAAYGALKEKESQLVLSTRLATVGQLAAGVAHEINNPAASIQLNLQQLRRDLALLRPSPEESSEGVETSQRSLVVSHAEGAVVDCLESIERIASTVKGLRGFARIDAGDVTWVDLNDVVRTACALARHQVRGVAAVDERLHDVPQIAGERGKLVQVIVNLLLNASHAIESGGGGRIEVTTRASGDGIVVQVADDGPGVSSEIAERIFQPFFTTKPAHQGMGLGLSLSADIVRQHSGSLRTSESELGGACFELFVPRDTGLEVGAVSRPRSAPEPSGSRILAIDDDVAMVRAYRRTLGRKNIVVGVHGGQEALDTLQRDDAFDVILCDLMMPGLDGVQLYESLAATKPHLIGKLIFLSGGPTTRRCEEFVRRADAPVLSKPIDPDALNALIVKKSAV